MQFSLLGFFFFGWTCRMVSSLSWCLEQKTPNRQGTPAASGGNEIWERPAAWLPSGISETVWVTSTQPAAAQQDYSVSLLKEARHANQAREKEGSTADAHLLTGPSGRWALMRLHTSTRTRGRTFGFTMQAWPGSNVNVCNYAAG